MAAVISRFNEWLALKVTKGVGTMWCAYAFTAVSLSALPSVLKLRSVDADVQWVAQTFLQLVLLSVIIVGQNIQSAKSSALHDHVTDLHAKVDDLSDGPDDLGGAH